MGSGGLWSTGGVAGTRWGFLLEAIVRAGRHSGSLLPRAGLSHRHPPPPGHRGLLATQLSPQLSRSAKGFDLFCSCDCAGDVARSGLLDRLRSLLISPAPPAGLRCPTEDLPLEFHSATFNSQTACLVQ